MKAVFSTLTILIVVLMINELLFLDLFGVGRLNAKRNFPQAASKMGLTADSPHKKRSFSNYSGVYRGCEILVAPEMGSIKVTMQRIPGLFINTFQKKASFATGDPTIDRFFTTRQAPSATQEKLADNERLILFLADFIDKWKRTVSQMDIEPGYVECRMRFGNGHYIPASVLEPMTSDLVNIVQLLQETIISNPPAVNEQ